MTTFWVIMILCSTVLILWSQFRVWQKQSAIKSSPQTKEVPAPDPWEKEWLENLRNQHHVVRIDQVPVRITGKVQKSSQGFKAVCSCGNASVGIDLAMSRRLYIRHLIAESEKAIAAIGKFEMPAGIDWMKEFKD